MKNDSNASQKDSILTTPSIEGVLEKKCKIGLWIKKYCKLVGNTFQIYKKAEDQKPENEIIMDSTISTKIIDSSLNRFKISRYQNTSSILLQAKTANTMMEWILCLRSCSFINHSMSMDMFQIISVIGRGEFGKVLLCQKFDTNEVVAIKTVHKKRLLQENKIHTILTERSILSKINNPFIVSLKYAFQTVSKFYLCLTYAAGGDLFHLLDHGPIPLHDIKLYVAEISIALNELHENGIIYRDLKPENILFNEKGHIRLTDFGLSKIVDKYSETRTFCGTSNYIAPEIIQRKKYGVEVDWWSLGVVLYEMMFGYTPFQSSNNQKVYINIIKNEPYFSYDADPDAKKLILSLLDKNPKTRGTFSTIKNSKFMQDLNFDNVYENKISPLTVPKLSSSISTENFDKEFTNEEPCDSVILSTGNPSQTYFSNFSYTFTDTCEQCQFGPEDREIAPTTFEND